MNKSYILSSVSIYGYTPIAISDDLEVLKNIKQKHQLSCQEYEYQMRKNRELADEWVEKNKDKIKEDIQNIKAKFTRFEGCSGLFAPVDNLTIVQHYHGNVPKPNLTLPKKPTDYGLLEIQEVEKV